MSQDLKYFLSKKDFYDILGVKTNATSGEIAKAYEKLFLEYHPESKTDPEIAVLIERAYNTLRDPETRKQYDVFARFPFEEKSPEEIARHFCDNQELFAILDSKDLLNKAIIGKIHKAAKESAEAAVLLLEAPILHPHISSTNWYILLKQHQKNREKQVEDLKKASVGIQNRSSNKDTSSAVNSGLNRQAAEKQKSDQAPSGKQIPATDKTTKDANQANQKVANANAKTSVPQAPSGKQIPATDKTTKDASQKVADANAKAPAPSLTFSADSTKTASDKNTMHYQSSNVSKEEMDPIKQLGIQDLTPEHIELILERQKSNEKQVAKLIEDYSQTRKDRDDALKHASPNEREALKGPYEAQDQLLNNNLVLIKKHFTGQLEQFIGLLRDAEERAKINKPSKS